MLHIQDLHAEIDGKEILKGLSLLVEPGEVHAIMGPNGAGKSTLSKVLSGDESITVTKGSISFQGKDLLEMSPEVRAREGLFIGYQYPVEIPGLSTREFLRASYNEVQKYKGKDPMDAFDFQEVLEKKAEELDLSKDYLERSFNEGFSGGEKKRNEILQMAMLEPHLAVLDEIDSGLDVDSLKTLSEGILRLQNEQRSQIIITHYNRILNHVEPDQVHVFFDGRIIKSGTSQLAHIIEEQGYDEVIASYRQQQS